MSTGAGDNRWRRGGGGGGPQSSRQQPPSRGDRSSGTSTPSRQDGGRQAMASYSGNAWGGQDRSRSGSSASGQAAQGDRARDVLGAGPVEEQHVPVGEYNAGETKEFLKMSYQEAVSAVADDKSLPWKLQDSSAPAKSNAPWASRPNTMTNGQDFWVQLRKQITNLEQAKAS